VIPFDSYARSIAACRYTFFSIPIPQNVVDHLHEDTTLRSRAAVCRSFRRPSQLHIFFTIHLGTPLASERLHDQINVKPEIAFGNSSLIMSSISTWVCIRPGSRTTLDFSLTYSTRWAIYDYCRCRAYLTYFRGRQRCVLVRV
jgi:hypothetical protein